MERQRENEEWDKLEAKTRVEHQGEGVKIVINQ